MNSKVYHKILIVIAITALSGCSGLLSSRKHPAKVDDISSTSRPSHVKTVSKKPVRGSKAVVQLMRKAQAQSESGDNVAAAATIERALRIEPKNPALWHNLALVKYKLGDCSSAVNMAKKSNAYSAKGHELKQKNSEIISECRK